MARIECKKVKNLAKESEVKNNMNDDITTKTDDAEDMDDDAEEKDEDEDKEKKDEADAE